MYASLWSLVCALESRPGTSSWISQTYSGCTVRWRKCSRLEEQSGEPESKAVIPIPHTRRGFFALVPATRFIRGRSLS